MLVAQSPISGHQRPKSSRKPLQPKNPSSTPLCTATATNPKPKPNPADWIEISQVDNTNKENVPPIYSTPVKKESFQIESFDASLAEELSAIREKLERLRVDKDKTDKMLRERGLMLDLQMKEILDRGELQKHLEIEVDRLYRLKEIKLSCMSISPLRSLREKEQGKKVQQDQLKANNHTENRDEQKEEKPIANSEFRSKDSELKLSQTLPADDTLSSSPSLRGIYPHQ